MFHMLLTGDRHPPCACHDPAGSHHGLGAVGKSWQQIGDCDMHTWQAALTSPRQTYEVVQHLLLQRAVLLCDSAKVTTGHCYLIPCKLCLLLTSHTPADAVT
jgi:hypothetical protein